MQRSIGELPAIVWIALAAAFAFYQLLFLHYRPYDIDNPWSLSFSYGFSHGTATDKFMGVGFPGGQDGTYLFGKLAGALQSVVGAVFDWQQRPFAVWSAFLVVTALGCWAVILRRQRASLTTILTFVFTAAISEPFVASAQRFRSEPLSFFLVSAGMLMATEGFIFPAMFCSLIAVETQPVALVGVVPVLILCGFYRRCSIFRLTAEVALAGIAGGLCQILLHPVMLHPGPLLAIMKAQEKPRTVGVFLYFAQLRHLPEILVFCTIPVLLTLRWRRGSLRNTLGQSVWLPIAAAATALAGVLMRHTNPSYVIFVYPLFIATLMVLLRRPRLQMAAAAFFAFVFLPQYVALAWLNRGQGYTAAEILKVRSEIDRSAREMGSTGEHIKVLGDYSLWFAHPENFRGNSPIFADSIGESDLLLCFRDSAPGASRPGTVPCNFFTQRLPDMQLLQTVPLHGRSLYFYRIHPAQQPSVSYLHGTWAVSIHV